MTKKFQIIGDGVMLYFDRAFDETGKLRKHLFSWYCKIFENTRCEYDKELGLFKVFYRDSSTSELQNKVLRHFSSGSGIDLHIFLKDNLTSVSKNFIGSEFVCNFNGITKIIYEEFFRVNPVKTPIQVAEENIRIKAIAEYGKISTKYQIDSILTEWKNPVPPTMIQIFGGAVK